MPASLPGSTNTANRTGNPNAGQAVIFDALSGPKGSPFDKDQAGNASTGAMCTGIGWGCNALVNAGGGRLSIAGSFTDDTGEGAAGNSSMIYIGGGKCTANVNGLAPAVPYTAGFAPGNAGNGGSRDAGAGPAFTCFAGKWVTATGAVANGAVIETGFVNRSGIALATDQFAFGSAVAAQAAPA